MAQGWRQYLEAGLEVREMTRAQAQKLVKQLVREGQLAEERARAYVDELIDRSRRRTDEIRKIAAKEIKAQLGSLGLVTKDDLAKLERRLDRKIAKAGGGGGAGKRTGAKDTGAKSTAKGSQQSGSRSSGGRKAGSGA